MIYLNARHSPDSTHTNALVPHSRPCSLKCVLWLGSVMFESLQCSAQWCPQMPCFRSISCMPSMQAWNVESFQEITHPFLDNCFSSQYKSRYMKLTKPHNPDRDIENRINLAGKLKYCVWSIRGVLLSVAKWRKFQAANLAGWTDTRVVWDFTELKATIHGFKAWFEVLRGVIMSSSNDYKVLANGKVQEAVQSNKHTIWSPNSTLLNE